MSISRQVVFDGDSPVVTVIDSAPATSSSPRNEITIVLRRRLQKGRLYKRSGKWVGSLRDYEPNPETGKRARRTITFNVSSKRAAEIAFQPYLDAYNAQARADAKPITRRGGKTVSDLVEEWKSKILPNRKAGGARASLSHIRTYILPLLGESSLREVNLSKLQSFVTDVGLRVNRRKTAENVFVTLSSILNSGRKWGHAIPESKRCDLEFPTDRQPKTQPFFFDADTAARVINAAVQPFRLMFLISAICGLRIGEVTALKLSSLDFKRKQISITAALDYATRKESTPKSENSAAPLHMPELLEKHLREWVEKFHTPNPAGYLFVNSKGRPYPSDNVVKYGVHRAMKKLGISLPEGGTNVGIHAFRHGVTSELLEAGTPIHVVTRMLRHGDSKVTLDHYAHIIGSAERVASEKFSRRIGENLAQLESASELESTNSKTA